MTDISREALKWESVYSASSLPPEGAEARSIYSAFTEYVQKKLKLQCPARILEAGSGSGLHSLALANAGFEVDLLDFSSNALNSSRAIFQRAGLKAGFHQNDVFAEDTLSDYDLVFNSGVLEHYSFGEQVRFLRAMARRSRRFIFVLVPNQSCYWYWIWRVKKQSMSEWPWGDETPAINYTTVFSEAGIRLVDISYFGSEFTEEFIASLGLPSDLQMIVNEVHRAEIIDIAMRAYLVGFLGIKAESTIPFDSSITGSMSSSDTSQDKVDRVIAKAADTIAITTRERMDHKIQLVAHESEIAKLTGTLKEQCGEIVQLKQNLADRETEICLINEEMQIMKQSRSWRMTKPLRDSRHLADMVSRKARTAVFLWRTQGAAHVLQLIGNRIKRKLRRRPAKNHYCEQLKLILEEHQERPVIVFRPVFDWKLPLLQRPQHIAKCLADQGFLYFYCTVNAFEVVDGFEQVHERCYVTDQFELVDKLKEQKIIHVYAADPNCTWSYIENHIKNEDLVIYEYVDEIHADIAGRNVSEELLDRHSKVLKREDIMCIASADKLYRDVARYRSNNAVLVSNGVELEHFSVARDRSQIPDGIRHVIAKDKAIIGYFGALAKWFDYELVIELARVRPDYEILLIGWNYDQSLNAYPIQDFPNITVIGPIDYKVLPQYACWFDVSTIPFRINEVTESTSPIKLFEYMALGHPIVTTDLPECRKYESALIARNHEEFVRLIDEALKKRKDDEYMSILKREAEENTWQSKATKITELIKGNLLRIRKEQFPDKLLDHVQEEIVSCYRLDAPQRHGYYEKYYRPEERFYWFPILNWIQNLASVERVADIGAAYGTLLLYTIKCHKPTYVLAVDALKDLSPNLIDRYNIHHLNMDIERSNLDGLGQFDLLLFTETIEHLNFHPMLILKRLRRMLSRDGVMILTTPDAAQWGRVTKYYPSLSAIPLYSGQAAEWIDDHIWQYTREEVEKIILDAGFNIVKFAYAPGVKGRHLCFLLSSSY